MLWAGRPEPQSARGQPRIPEEGLGRISPWWPPADSSRRGGATRPRGRSFRWDGQAQLPRDTAATAGTGPESSPCVSETGALMLWPHGPAGRTSPPPKASYRLRPHLPEAGLEIKVSACRAGTLNSPRVAPGRWATAQLGSRGTGAARAATAGRFLNLTEPSTHLRRCP